jgi:hypothetical protein
MKEKKVKAQSLDSHYADAAKTLQAKGDGQSESADVVTAPKVWKSSPKHPTAYLVYITAEEAKHLAKLDMHGSGVDRKMHFGPNGVPSYQGDGGGGGDGGGDSGGSDGSDSPSDSATGGAANSDDGGMSGGAGVGDSIGSTTDADSGSDAPAGELGAPDGEPTAPEPTMSDLVALTTLAPLAADDSPRQFPTREQNARRRAQAGGATRVDNDADLLGYTSTRRARSGAARRTLGSR